MKRILGLDLGTTSIGWALVNESETASEVSSIENLGVRRSSIDNGSQQEYLKGKNLTANATRTACRSARHNRQRYQLRRNNLIRLMKEQGWITDNTILAEDGKSTTYATYRLRAKAATEEITLEEFARVLLMINKKRGYKSNRKDQSDKANEKAIERSKLLKELSDNTTALNDNNKTIGQHLWEQLNNTPHCQIRGSRYYRQDYQHEFNTIWETQASFHPDKLTPELKNQIAENIIFFQRPLKSQKHLVRYCEFESREIEIDSNGKKVKVKRGLKVCPKSSPIFQEFRTWQMLANLRITDSHNTPIPLQLDDLNLLAKKLSFSKDLKAADILKQLKLPEDCRLNYEKIVSNHTNDSLKKNGAPKDMLCFDATLPDPGFERQPSFRLWHLIYSYQGDNSKSGNDGLVAKIEELFGLDHATATKLASTTFEDGFGNLSSKAMRKILPYLKQGLTYDKACEAAGYNHSHSLTREENAERPLADHLSLVPKGSLRNPLVEKILNQTVHVVNGILDEYGRPDEIRIEMARDLKKTSKQRADLSKKNKDMEKTNKEAVKRLQENGLQKPTPKDILKYKLFEELRPNEYKGLYSGRAISINDLIENKVDVEHIIPQSLFFDDSFINKTLEFTDENLKKSNWTARDYMEREKSQAEYEEYLNNIDKLHRTMPKAKIDRLLWHEQDIPTNFLNRDISLTQYITKEANSMLLQVCRKVTHTTGSITKRLRDDWHLTDVLKELTKERYGDDEMDNWTKRDDHRHHAVDALATAFTTPAIIQLLNHLNSRRPDLVGDEYDNYSIDNLDLDAIPNEERGALVYALRGKLMRKDKHNKWKFRTPFGTPSEFRAEAKLHLENILVSIKPKNNSITCKTQKCGKRPRITPHGKLHDETLYGAIQHPIQRVKVDSTFDEEKILRVTRKDYREALLQRLHDNDNKPKKAFTGRNALDKNPIFLNHAKSRCVPPTVDIIVDTPIYTKREDITKLNPNQIEKVIDPHIRQLLQARLAEYDGDAKKAFSDLTHNPIMLNEKQGIDIRHVTLDASLKHPIALRHKQDHLGHTIPCDKQDFVSTDNNHHVAIFLDANGDLQEHIVSFFEASQRKIDGLPIIDKEYKRDEGWRFLFSMKQNEYFVFPNAKTGFDPNEINLLDPKNASRISPNLFRVQKFSSKYYVFRHHLETSVENEAKELRDITWKRIQNVNGLNGIVKVRVDHLGRIVAVGEY
ncbi:MAG: type II CRISPR RNA-guided endonuclease Cas9 [Bacteroidales bacterium]|nr:type II CRISPR RNA-guided endonuclease Cas9 [Bacteroidales bacterium]